MELSTKERIEYLEEDIEELKKENKELQFQKDEMAKELALKQHRVNELEYRLRSGFGKPSG